MNLNLWATDQDQVIRVSESNFIRVIRSKPVIDCSLYGTSEASQIWHTFFVSFSVYDL